MKQTKKETLTISLPGADGMLATINNHCSESRPLFTNSLEKSKKNTECKINKTTWRFCERLFLIFFRILCFHQVLIFIFYFYFWAQSAKQLPSFLLTSALIEGVACAYYSSQARQLLSFSPVFRAFRLLISISQTKLNMLTLISQNRFFFYPRPSPSVPFA